MTRYVAGFLVSDDRHYVALIRKKRPAWQEGRLNGIGGHIEEGELPLDAMEREFEEETGQTGHTWRQTVRLSGEGFEVYFFVAFGTPDQLLACRAGATDERVEIHSTTPLPSEAIGNLHWLVPLSIGKDNLAAEVREGAGWVEPAGS